MLSTFLLTVLPALTLATFVVPLPNGPYGVSIQDTLVTDYGQPDPYLNLTYRRVPVSIIAPTGSSADCKPVLQPYMPKLVGTIWENVFDRNYGLPLNNTITQTELILCEPSRLDASTPVVLFAPGAGVSRYLYNLLGSAIVAQTGYTVITFDAPGQTAAVVYPDGSVQYAANSSTSTTARNADAVAVVVEDGLIVLDAVFGLNNATGEGRGNISVAPAPDANLVNVDQAAFIGHSQGGAASLAGLLVDPRLSGGANMDGGFNATADAVAVCADSNFFNTTDPTSSSSSMQNCSSSATTTRPFMIVEHQSHNQTNADGWTEVWADVLQGTKWQVELNDSQHATFGDYAYLMDLYGIREKADANVTLVDIAVGSVPGTQVLETLSELFKAFLGYAFATGSSESGMTADNVTATVAELDAFGLIIVNQTIVE